MRDKDDADPFFLQVSAGFHQLRHLFFSKRGGRLIHYDHLRVNKNRLVDLHHLLNSHAETPRRKCRIDLLSEGPHDFFCFPVHGRIVQKAILLFQPLIDKNIVGHAQQRFRV